MAAIAFSNRSMSSTALVAQRSRHRIRPFRLHRPTSADEAAAIFAASTGAAAYFGGGIDVVATLKTGVVLNDVIHLGSLPAWTAISEQDDAIAIAGGVTHQRLVDDPLLRQRYPALCAAWASVANHRIRIKGTLAGNLMAANPVYDFALAAIALGARLDYLDSGRLSAQVPAERISDIPHGALLTHIMLPRDACFAFVMQCEWKPIVSFAL
jgi:CO/xanthine dehydrogenase FAD-binding subunit